ncbi:hypothetical protein J6590_031073 [Homalodisca vitripennis]|nr:hypothetical protein J6590_031073 [Homalodisca vitripennis]
MSIRWHGCPGRCGSRVRPGRTGIHGLRIVWIPYLCYALALSLFTSVARHGSARFSQRPTKLNSHGPRLVEALGRARQQLPLPPKHRRQPPLKQLSQNFQ